MNPPADRVVWSSLLGFAFLGGLFAATNSRADDPTPAPVPRPIAKLDAIDRARLEAHVKLLASPEYGGRGSPDDRETAWTYVAAQLSAAGAKPAPGSTSMLRPFKAKVGVLAGTNVVGWVAGAEASEYVIVSAHFDHLGKKRVGEGEKTTEEMFPGADDNASGLAALIEIARALAAGPKLKRSVLVLAFDLEETNCAGSRAYVEDPALPLERCVTFTTIDMLGRSLADMYPGLLMVMGAERADALLAATAAMPAAPGVVWRDLGMDFNALGWSDYVPFEEKKISSLFFTSGACRDYHRPTDTAEKIDYPALHARSATVLAAVRSLADADARPVWKDVATPRLLEIESVHALVKGAGAKEEEMQIPAGMRAMRKNFEDRLAATIARGTVTVGERAGVRIGALMLFEAALRAR